MARKAFQLPEPTPDILIINKKSMHTIKDIAHRIWVETKAPNANLIMFQALHDYMVQLGIEPKFKVET